jgi:hypothetical protein
LKKARPKSNLNNFDRSEDQAKESQNPVADVQVGQDWGVGLQKQAVNGARQIT